MNDTFSNALLVIGSILSIAGTLFKIMHWPGSGWLFIAGLVIGLVGLVSFGLSKFKNPKG
jgi:hypothetical protein